MTSCVCGTQWHPAQKVKQWPGKLPSHVVNPLPKNA